MSLPSHLPSDQHLRLHPLMLLAPPVLEPHPDDSGVEAGHLCELFLGVGVGPGGRGAGGPGGRWTRRGGAGGVAIPQLC